MDAGLTRFMGDEKSTKIYLELNVFLSMYMIVMIYLGEK